MTENLCGSCTLCCKVMNVPEMNKVDGEWCSSCIKGVGCAIYKDRPQRCQDFLCLWRSGFGEMGKVGPDYLKPDKCKVVFSAGFENEKVICAFVDQGYPLAWQAEKVLNTIKSLADGGFIVVVSVKPNSTEKIVFKKIGDGTVSKETITMTEPDENGVQWFKPKGRKNA